MRLVEGEFPDYNQVVPQKSERHMLVGVEPLLAALRRVSIVSSERTRGVKLQLDTGKLEISSINPDVGEASEEIAVEYDGAAVQHRLQRQVPDRRAGGAVAVCAGSRSASTTRSARRVIRCEGDADFLYVVMPMRL